MTLVAAWVRKFELSEELVIASDSRLTGGMRWDCCPKIFPLDREDSAICFAGTTNYAYPIIMQIHSMINMNFKLSSRAKDIYDLQNSIINIVNEMLEYRFEFSSAPDAHNPDVDFLFAGYSWKYNHFMAWKYQYSLEEKTFSYQKIKTYQNGYPFIFIGDKSESNTAKRTLLTQLRRNNNNDFKLDMEPFDILKSFIESDSCHSIGGPIQLVKIYKHLNCRPFNINFNDSKTLLGRPLLPYEKNNFLTLDADTKKITDQDGNELISTSQDSSI